MDFNRTVSIKYRMKTMLLLIKGLMPKSVAETREENPHPPLLILGHTEHKFPQPRRPIKNHFTGH